MTVDYLIPADLRTSMDELAAHVAAGRFEAVLAGLLAATESVHPDSIRARIVMAIRGGGEAPPQRFADDAAGIAARLDALDPRARAVAVFMLLPCAGDCTPRLATESDFAFTVRLFGSHALVWRVAGGAALPQLPGLADAVLAGFAKPLTAARRYLDRVPRAADWLEWFAAGGRHPDAAIQRDPLPVVLARWFAGHRNGRLQAVD